jgi:hypothetical protein
MTIIQPSHRRQDDEIRGRVGVRPAAAWQGVWSFRGGPALSAAVTNAVPLRLVQQLGPARLDDRVHFRPGFVPAKAGFQLGEV